MVAQYLGDGVLAYFGYPAAHEDDAERAIRAGLAIIDRVGKPQSTAHITLQARIGIASGVVVVGDLVRGGRDAGERGDRRDDQLGGAAAVDRRAQYHRDWTREIPPRRRAVRISRTRPADAQVGVLRAATYHCSPYHQDSALYPIIGQLLRAAGIERDRAEERLTKVEALLAQSSENLAEDMPLFAALLSIPGGDRFPLPTLTPQRLKERTLRALLDQLKKLAAIQPVLMVFEDLHGIAPTSLELLSLTVDQAPSLRFLFLATCRPEFTPPWPIHRHRPTAVIRFHLMSVRAPRHRSAGLPSCWSSAGLDVAHPAVGIAWSREPASAPCRPAFHVRVERSACLDPAYNQSFSINPRNTAPIGNDNSP
jgi:hypothetical protein